MTHKQPIQMVDLQTQYHRLKNEIDQALLNVIESGAFINGPSVKQFSRQLASYLDDAFVIPCGNGTDALQLALMSLPLCPGDEIVVPAFTYVAAAEAAVLLGLVPVFVDVDPATFNMDPDQIEQVLTPKTRAIVPVHLFGQSCNMHPIMEIANRNNLYVIEDNAQALGCEYTDPSGVRCKAGTIGHIGTLSFFPSKPLGCYGDGGAVVTKDETLAARIQMMANHGQPVKYNHQFAGCNSRLDTIQAAILHVKLPYIDTYAKARQEVAARYDCALAGHAGIRIPFRAAYSTHVFHQYTLQVGAGVRDRLQRRLKDKGIPSMIYYPCPLHRQPAYRQYTGKEQRLPVAQRLSETVLSLPIHTEMSKQMQEFIIENVLAYTD